jgi:hypothetical protein
MRGANEHEARAAVGAFDCVEGPREHLECEESVQEEQEDDVGGGDVRIER